DRYQDVADNLKFKGYYVIQFDYGEKILDGVVPIKTKSFRDSLLFLNEAFCYIGPEGGLHHASGALRKKAIIIFGGFTSPELFGYDFHENIFTGGIACGNKYPCDHCKDAMTKITPE